MKKIYLIAFFLFSFTMSYGQKIDFDHNIKLYPNPAHHVVSIQTNVPLQKVEIYTLVGDKVHQITKNFHNISLRHLPRGIYMVKIYSRKGYTVKKLIKE